MKQSKWIDNKNKQFLAPPVHVDLRGGIPYHIPVQSRKFMYSSERNALDESSRTSLSFKRKKRREEKSCTDTK